MALEDLQKIREIRGTGVSKYACEDYVDLKEAGVHRQPN
jgi:hypothetical protein